MRLRSFAAAVVLLTAGAARAQPAAAAADTWTVDAKQSSVTYHLVHKLHKFDGTSRAVEGKARLLPSGQAQVMVRVPVESFDSGNTNRDEHMKETVEAARFPTVELKGLADGITVPATFPSKLEKKFKAQITFHGVQQVFDLPIALEFVSANEVRATSSFVVSVEAFKIDRPSLMFVKIEDDMHLDVKVVFKR
jgi:polyisoprenoid-binding protein YceI